MQEPPRQRPTAPRPPDRDALARELLGTEETEPAVTAPVEAELQHSLFTTQEHGGGTTPAESLAPRFELEHELGQGGMGTVYAAFDTMRARRVALKRVPGGDPELERRLLEEARTLGSLQHEHIVACHDVGHDRDGLFLSMELLEGGSLDERLARGPLAEDEVLELGARLLSALAVAHAAGVIHRDVKPGNILFDAAGQPKLGDFGLARREERLRLTLTGAAIGTLAYMAPEQATGAVDARADLYSLAATLYHCLSGESPRVVREARIPERFRQVLLRALEEDPSRRYADAFSFHQALLALRETPEAAAQAAAPEAPKAPPASARAAPAQASVQLPAPVRRELDGLDQPGHEAQLLWTAIVYGHAQPAWKPLLESYLERARARPREAEVPCEQCGTPEAANLLARLDGVQQCTACMHVRAARVKAAYRHDVSATATRGGLPVVTRALLLMAAVPLYFINARAGVLGTLLAMALIFVFGRRKD